MRPSTILSSGRTPRSFRPTPRSVTLASVPVSALGTFTTVTSSFDSSALPSASLASPGALLMVSMSARVRLLLSSASEPPRRMMARSARPLSASVCLKPAPIASTDTNTATTPAMPMTMTLEAPSRCGRVCRLIEMAANSCLNIPMLRVAGAPGLLQCLSASASTIFSFMARSAGGVPTSSASSAAAAKPGSRAVGDSSTPCSPRRMMGSAA